jgi:transcriptional regulator with XRE-family HTH domain
VILKHVDGQPLRKLGRESGVSFTTLSAALAGRRGLSADALEKLAVYFDLVLVERRKRRRAKS